MSMEEDLRELYRYSSMADAMTHLVAIRVVEEYIREGAALTLGDDHLGMVAIHEADQNLVNKINDLAEAIGAFERKVKDTANDVLRALGATPESD